MLIGPQKILADKVAGLVHSDRKLDAAQEINEFCQLGLKLDNDPKTFTPVLQHWFHFLVNNGGIENAAEFLWTPTQFSTKAKFTQDLWKFFDEATMGLIMGAASCSKSYSIGVRLLLEYYRDPLWTTVKVLGPSEAHLSANLFSHLVSLHASASIPMPGSVGDLFIGTNRRDQLGSITGVVIPVGQTHKAGRLQGVKSRPRPNSHPIFGPLSRVFVFLDEAANIPIGVWKDIENLLSNVQEGEFSGTFKILGAFNPSAQEDNTGKRAEPVKSWAAFDEETDFRWKSKLGWDVLRLSGEKSENVVEGRIVFPGLQTRAGLAAIEKNSGGKSSAGYSIMGKGMFPLAGVELTIIPPGMLQKWRGTFLYYDEPIAVGSVDLALEGGAACVYTLGKWGRATGIQLPPSIEFPRGTKIMFRDRSGHSITRWALQADQQFVIPKGETVATAERIININRKAGVRGEYFACDRTGAGAGTADLIRHDWSSSIHDVNYSEACSKDRIMLENKKTCNEEFERCNTELWFRLKAWGEFQYFLINPVLDMTKLTGQLTQRKFRIVGGKTRIEPKIDYINRGNESPDEADSLTLFVHAACKGSGAQLSMNLDESSDVSPGSEDYDGWYDDVSMLGGARIDVSNRTDVLDDFSQRREEAIL